jgi:lysophospholipid acyltransferase (LPLAT)-like uncharacterized protein
MDMFCIWHSDLRTSTSCFCKLQNSVHVRSGSHDPRIMASPLSMLNYLLEMDIMIVLFTQHKKVIEKK